MSDPEQLTHHRKEPDVYYPQKGDVVQLNEKTGNPGFRYCFMIVTEPKGFGAQGFVQALGTREGPGGQAYYRAKFEEMEYIGRAVYVPDNLGELE